MKNRTIVFYKDHFQRFFDTLGKKEKEKIIWTFQLIEDLERIPETYLKHLEGTTGLYEIRVQHSSSAYRIFCFSTKETSLWS